MSSSTDWSSIVGFVERAWADDFGVLGVLLIMDGPLHRALEEAEASDDLGVAGICLAFTAAANITRNRWGLPIAHVVAAHARRVGVTSATHTPGARILRRLGADEEPDERDSGARPVRRYVLGALPVTHDDERRCATAAANLAVLTEKIDALAVNAFAYGTNDGFQSVAQIRERAWRSHGQHERRVCRRQREGRAGGLRGQPRHDDFPSPQGFDRGAGDRHRAVAVGRRRRGKPHRDRHEPRRVADLRARGAARGRRGHRHGAVHADHRGEPKALAMMAEAVAVRPSPWAWQPATLWTCARCAGRGCAASYGVHGADTGPTTEAVAEATGARLRSQAPGAPRWHPSKG